MVIHMRTIINWNIFRILLGASIVSIFAVLPYVLTIQGDMIKQIGIPLHTIFVLQLVQSVVLFSVSIFFGLLLARKIGFHLPVLEAWITKKNYKKIISSSFLQSCVYGVIVAITIYAADYLFMFQGTTITTSKSLAPVWQTLLAALYGGISEEILMRLFLMSLFIWLSMKVTRQQKPTNVGIIISIILASIIFGLGHLPITAAITTITPLVVFRAIILNGIGGIVFGWLYWKKGLEASIVAHFTTDIVLLTLLPILFSIRNN